MNPYEGRPLFDIASLARRGPGRRDSLTPSEIEQIRRLVTRSPEVMVKVLSQGAGTPTQVRNHLQYIAREGEVPLEADTGERVEGREAVAALVKEWDLELPAAGESERDARGRGVAPRLVHKLMLSMPPGTPPAAVLAAARDFAREEFALKHRYAMVLHTDRPHPHVHLVVKAISEHGGRVRISKATLRLWRANFARRLCAHGVEALATDHAPRGIRRPLRDVEPPGDARR